VSGKKPFFPYIPTFLSLSLSKKFKPKIDFQKWIDFSSTWVLIFRVF